MASKVVRIYIRKGLYITIWQPVHNLVMPIFLRTRKWNGEVFSEEGVNDMKALSRLAKILSIPLIALSLLLNISLGLAIFFIWRIILAVKKMADLEVAGTQVIATVTRIETLETRSLGNS